MRLGRVRYESKYLAIQYFHTEKQWDISWMCKTLKIARASYYKWLHREIPEEECKNIELAALIQEYDDRFGHILGYRRMTQWINHFNGTSYSQKRISLVETEDQRIVFTYSGRNLSKAEMFDKRHDSDRPFLSYYFKYDGKQLSRIEVMSSGAAKGQLATPLQQRWLAYMHEAMGVPATAVDNVCRKAADTKEVIVEIMKLTWSGGNVSSMTIERDYGSMKVDYTYDTKNNPYSHFLYTLGGFYTGEGIEFANQNNITKVVTTYKWEDMEEEAEERTEDIYHYTYQNDWPVVKQRVQVYGDEEEGSRVTERTFNYYEYDD